MIASANACGASCGRLCPQECGQQCRPHSIRSGLAERPEGRADLGGEELRLLPGCKVVAPVDLVEVNELGVGFLSPTARRLVELSREDATAAGNLVALASKKPSSFSQ